MGPSLLVLVGTTPQASELAITAEFAPRASAPNAVKFTNTTPQSGYCNGSVHCRPGEFTLTIPLTIERQWQNPGPPEGHGYQRVDGDWKTVNVSHDRGPMTVPLQFRLNLLARRYDLGTLAPGGTVGSIGIVANASGAQGASSGDCRGRAGAGHDTMYSFAWTVPAGWTTCSRPPKPEPLGPYTGTISQVSIGYELEAPNPFALSNGTYRGALTYTLGPGQQIDLGNGQYSDAQVTFNFELKVLHELRVDFPADSHRVVLEPDGGWPRWLAGSRLPPRLERVHPFQISASAPMKMYLKCDTLLSNRCSLREPISGHRVPLVVAVSLPREIRHKGNPVQALPLPLGEDQALAFQSVAVAAGRPGRLHYSVDAPHVATMMKRTGRQYTGNVTIVFDAQL